VTVIDLEQNSNDHKGTEEVSMGGGEVNSYHLS